MREKEPLRCGLCQIVILGQSWKEHEQSEGHQSKLRISVPVKALPAYVESIKRISKASQKKNRDKIARAENLGYHSVSNGRSYYSLRCECGEVSDVFLWRGCKRCPNCKKILHTTLSFRE